MLVGYLRVSKADGSQATDLQRDALLAAGVEALAQRLQASGQARPVVPLAGEGVLVEVPGLDAGGQQGVALQVGRLAAVRLAHPQVTDQHGPSSLT